MSTLDEVYKQAGRKFPFTAVIRHDENGTSSPYIIEGVTSSGYYFTDQTMYKYGERWELYEEPKPKVKMWRWLIKDSTGYYESVKFFATKDEAGKYYNMVEVIKPLLYTEIEI